MLTQGPPGTERSAERCVPAQNTLEYPIRLKLAQGYIAGVRLLQDLGQIEFHTLLHDALTGHEGKLLEPMLCAFYTRSEQNMTGVHLSFPEHGNDGSILTHPDGFKKSFSIKIQIPTAFVTAALERSSEPEHVSYLSELQKYSADPAPIPPGRLRDMTYSLAHRFSQQIDQGPVANWLLAEQVLIQASASRTFPL